MLCKVSDAGFVICMLTFLDLIFLASYIASARRGNDVALIIIILVEGFEKLCREPLI